MIIYHEELDQNFSDYGIDVPMADDRGEKTFKIVKAEFPNKVKDFDLSLLPSFTKEDLCLVHDKEFIERLYSDEHTLQGEIAKCFDLFNEDGSPNRFNQELVKKPFSEFRDRLVLQCAASYYAMKYCLTSGFSYFLAGGMHHSMSFGGRGFCLLNDAVIGIKKLQEQSIIKTAWIVDVDAHKGDGAAELCCSDSSIKTMSIHMKDGWPLEGDKLDESGELNPWFIASNIDVEVSRGEEYLYISKLKNALFEMYALYGAPDVVVIANGADPYEADELPGTSFLNLTKSQMLERDMLLYEFFKEKNIPQTYVMAGGYGKKTYEIYTQFLRKVIPSL